MDGGVRKSWDAGYSERLACPRIIHTRFWKIPGLFRENKLPKVGSNLSL